MHRDECAVQWTKKKLIDCSKGLHKVPVLLYCYTEAAKNRGT
jgi:hypothetical protein